MLFSASFDILLLMTPGEKEKEVKSEDKEKSSGGAAPGVSASFSAQLKSEWSRLYRDRRFQIFAGLLFILAIAFFLFIPSSGETEAEKKKAAEQVYVQWSIAMLASDGDACEYMTEDAQEAFLAQVSLPESTIAEGCDTVIPIISENLKLREPYEPVKLIEKLTRAIDRLEVNGNSVSIYTDDFAQGAYPIVVSKESDEWLISADSFKHL